MTNLDKAIKTVEADRFNPPTGEDLKKRRGGGPLPRPALDRCQDKYEPEPNSGCWLWIGALTDDGYGCVYLPNKRRYRAHIVMYEAAKGRVPDGLCLDHKCRIKSCVNPDHLEAVTPRENTLRSDPGKHKRAQTHCKNGHAFSEGNTKVDQNGRRACRACHLINNAKYREKKRATR